MARTVSQKSSRTFITQTPFYSPAFNGAVFDGPVRIYFAQSQEGLAMRLYLYLRSQAQLWKGLSARSKDAHVLIMIYPNSEIFELCCGSQSRNDSLTGRVGAVEDFQTFTVGMDRLFAIQSADLESHFEQVTSGLIQSVRSLFANHAIKEQLAFP